MKLTNTNILVIVSLCFFLFHCHQCLDNGLAKTPPMGWNAWGHYMCDTKEINEQLFMSMADAMIESGMAKAGYQYINIDDCWLSKTRDAQGKLQPDPERFPSGMKALGDYIHGKGLKFGIYEDVGDKTCAGYPGSLDHESLDAETFAEWGVDYLKLDGCNIDTSEYEKRYVAWEKALNATSRPIVYSCSWPAYVHSDKPNLYPYWNETMEICNLWRYYRDIHDDYSKWREIADHTAKFQDVYQPLGGPGHWNDPDMIMAGNMGTETVEEYQAQMSVWAILAAPLLASCDLRNMTDEIRQILINEEVIAVDQDRLGVQGRRIEDEIIEIGSEVWIRPLSDGSFAAAMLSKLDWGHDVTLKLSVFGWEKAHVRDLWQHTDIGVVSGEVKMHVKKKGVVMLKLQQVQ